MATGLSMNGKKKIETIQKEFTAKFPYLTLVFLDEAKSGIEGTKTLAEVRKSKGEDVSIMASQKVNSLEKNFLKNYGLLVEVAYQLGSELVLTTSDENRTLNELNRWCELNGCSKIRYQGTAKVTQKEPTPSLDERNEVYEEDQISYAEEKLEAIKKAIKVLRDLSFGDKSVEVEIYTEDFISRDTIENCEVEGRSIKIKRTNWWEDSFWFSIHTKESAIALLLNLYKYGTCEGLSEPEVNWQFADSGENDNGCDVEVIYSEIFDTDSLPDEVLTEDGEIDVWELRDYYGYSEQQVDQVDFEDISFEKITFKFGGQELLLVPSEINDLVLSNPPSSSKSIAAANTPSPTSNPIISPEKSLDDQVVKVYQAVESRLLRYDSGIRKVLTNEVGSISFKLPYPNLEHSTLIVYCQDSAYFIELVGTDQSLMKRIVEFRPDQVKLSQKGVTKVKSSQTAGELFASLVDFICILRMKAIEFNDGMKLYYAGYNYYTDEVGGKPKYQILSGVESSIFGLVDTVQLGNQTWSDRNLQTSFFANGDPIEEARTAEEWQEAAAEKRPAWCYYQSDVAQDETFGKLYNWYALNDPRGLAPKGWKIPSLEDFQELVTYLGGPGVAASKLKSKEFWGNDANGDLQFNAVPGGYRQANGTFDFLNQLGFWWTSSQAGDKGKFMTLGQNQPNVTIGDGLTSLGLSVRCLKESLICKGLQELIDEGIAVNLYRQPKLFDAYYYFADKSELPSAIKEHGSMFLDHLYAIPFKSDTKGVVDKVFKFLDKQLSVDYKSLMFKSGMHHPVIGIFNAKTNELLGLGIGRKNRIFFVSTVESINDQNYQSFSKLDYCKVITTTYYLLEKAADAQIGIMDAIEAGDRESEEDYSQALEEAMEDLLSAYPYLPSSIADLSPGDF